LSQEEKLRKVFDELDVNKNGYIDFEEVTLGPKNLFLTSRHNTFYIESVVSFFERSSNL
jgi:Ca2+-binding EF-hand superfamily protein